MSEKFWMLDDDPDYARVARAGAGWDNGLVFSGRSWVVDTDAITHAAWHLKELIFGPDHVTGERDDIDVFLMNVILTTIKERCPEVQ